VLEEVIFKLFNVVTLLFVFLLCVYVIQRQVEVGAVLDGYLRTLVKLCDSETNAELQAAMLGN